MQTDFVSGVTHEVENTVALTLLISAKVQSKNLIEITRH